MVRTGFTALMLLLTAAHVGAAQRMPPTTTAAEEMGASFAHYAAPRSLRPAFAAPYSGSADRRCVSPFRDHLMPGGSLRSGEFIVRGNVGLTGAYGLRANRPNKVLWIPLHDPRDYPDTGTLLIRGIRIGSAADSLRLTKPHWAVGDRNAGFLLTAA